MPRIRIKGIWLMHHTDAVDCQQMLNKAKIGKAYDLITDIVVKANLRNKVDFNMRYDEFIINNNDILMQLGTPDWIRIIHMSALAKLLYNSYEHLTLKQVMDMVYPPMLFENVKMVLAVIQCSTGPKSDFLFRWRLLEDPEYMDITNEVANQLLQTLIVVSVKGSKPSYYDGQDYHSIRDYVLDDQQIWNMLDTYRSYLNSCHFAGKRPRKQKLCGLIHVNYEDDMIKLFSLCETMETII